MNHFNVTALVPSCPPHTDPTTPPDWDFPSTTIIYSLDIILSLVLALFIGMRNNSFQVHDMVVQANAITNNQWLAYYVINGSRATFSLFRYLVQYKTGLDEALQVISLVLTGLCCLVLSLALNHQYRYRSVFAPRVQEEEESLYSRRSNTNTGTASIHELTRESFMKPFLGIQTPLAILYMIYLLTIYIEFTVADLPDVDRITWPFFLLFYFIQHVPIVVFTYLIVMNKNLSEGPTLWARVILSLGICLNLMFDIPMAIWAGWMDTDSCLFGFASVLDLFEFLFVVSLAFFMIFIRLEFVRNRDEATWRAQSWKENSNTV